MAVKGSATITLTQYRDTQSVTRYYKLQPAGSSAPLKPETKPPSSDWTDSEPACDISKELYFCDLTIFSNGEWEYSKVSKSTSYEAAKQAYNRADNAQKSIDNLEVGGRNYVVKQDSFSLTVNGITFDYDGDVYHVYGTNTKTDTNYFVKIFVDTTDVFEPGAVYTISTTTPLPNGLYLGINTRNSIGTEIIAASNSYFHGDGSKTSNTFTCTQDTNGELRGFFGVNAYCGTVDVTFKIKLEKGNRATDWTPAPEDVDADIDDVWEKADNAQTSIDNLEIGGRNLFLNTGKTVSNNDYKISEYAPANGPLKAGEIYTATICVTPAENLSEIRVYFSQAYLAPVRFYPNGTNKQVISETFTMAYYDGRTPDINPSYGYAQLYRFPNDGTVTGNTTVHWFKIEKGNKATDWTPAPEDIESRTTVLEAASAKELVRNGFAEFTNDPKLTLGKTTSPWKVVVKNDGIFLQKSSNDVASLSKETSSEETTLRADNARLANVKFRSANGGGKLGIVAQSNGHVSLKEI